jgi:alpha-L-glutamate ligase-like protein
MLALARRLHERGVLGLNKRNAEYILPCNPRHLYPLVDDKLLTKELALKAKLAVPELYGVIHTAQEVRNFASIIEGRDSFVVKPAQGSGGEGIIVITDRVRGLLSKASGALMTMAELEFHIQNILSGIFSLGGQADKVLVEYCVEFDPVFAKITYQGVPDVRVIVYRGYPVMAMVRLPTRMSGGRANLHQGAIGAGIDMATGRTLSAVLRNDIVSEHPDTFAKVSGVKIPHWGRILEIAAGTYELTGLGYQGVDIVLDKRLGPLILELNARPGLNIQIANRAGLVTRLEAVDDQLLRRKRPVSDRVMFAKDAFKVT